jgi:hypothetical protein
MSESITERLKKFTPDGSGLDRDALLFAAGRASARPNRRWLALCAALAASQLVTLGLWCWPRPMVPPPGGTAPIIAKESKPAAPPQEPALWRLREQALATDGNLPTTAPVEHPVASEPTWHAFGTLPSSLLN